jgi:hypothetical protein
MIKRITGFSAITTSEGKRITYTYSKISEETGEVIENNIKEYFIAFDDNLLKNIDEIEKIINMRIANK